MTFYHTPGPWKQECEGMGSLIFSSDWTMIVAESSGEDWQANGALIAIAPEMLQSIVLSLNYPGLPKPVLEMFETLLNKLQSSPGNLLNDPELLSLAEDLSKDLERRNNIPFHEFANELATKVMNNSD